MNRAITESEETFFHLKYGASLRVIRGIWTLSDSAEELTAAFERYHAIVNDPEQMRLVASIAKHREEMAQ